VKKQTMSDTKWKPGESGNPAGRKPGATLAGRLRDAVGKDFDAIVEAVIKAAKEGDMQAASLLLSRTCPPVRPVQEPVAVPLAGETLTEKAGAILDAVGRGELAPMDAKTLLDGLGAVAKVREIDELERRLAALEARNIEEETQ
jgi:hypothetical protein